MSRKPRKPGNFRSVDQIEFRNGRCLHCVVIDLANFWVESGKDEPEVVLIMLSEAIGALLTQISDPDERDFARTRVGEIILDVSEPTVGHA